MPTGNPAENVVPRNGDVPRGYAMPEPWKLNDSDWLEQIYFNPGTFATQFLNLDPTNQQQRLFDLIAEGHKQVAVRSGHGIGKTTALAIIIIWFLFTRRNCLVVCTATKESQLKIQLWGEVRRILSNAASIVCDAIVVDSTRIYTQDNPHDAQAFLQVARKENPEALQGHHHDHLLILADEASGIPDSIFEPIEGSLTKDDNLLILTGNPTRLQGYFYDAFHKNRVDFRSLHFSSLDSPLVDARFVRRAARYGLESNFYRVRVLGEFPKSDDDSLIRLEWCEAANARYEETPFEEFIKEYLDVCRETKAKPDGFVIGVDPGRSLDGDASGMVARWKKWVIKYRQHWVRDEMKVVWLAVNFRNEIVDRFGLPFDFFAVDTIGLGAGVYDRLKEMGESAADVNVGREPMTRGKRRKELDLGGAPAKLRDELYLMVRNWVRIEGMLPDCDGLLDALISEMTAPKYDIVSDGKIKVESKDSMKKRGIASPNMLDAMGLTFYPHATTGRASMVDTISLQ